MNEPEQNAGAPEQACRPAPERPSSAIRADSGRGAQKGIRNMSKTLNAERGADSQQRMVGPRLRLWHDCTNCKVCPECNGFGRFTTPDGIGLCKKCEGSGFANTDDAKWPNEKVGDASDSAAPNRKSKL